MNEDGGLMTEEPLAKTQGRKEDAEIPWMPARADQRTDN